ASYALMPASRAVVPSTSGTASVAKPSVLVSVAGPAHTENGTSSRAPPRKLIPEAVRSAAHEAWPSDLRNAPGKGRRLRRATMSAIPADEVIAGGTVDVLQSLMAGEVFESVAVQKLPSGKQPAVDRAQLCVIADRLPGLGDRRDLLFDQGGGFSFLQVIIGRG